MISRRIELRAIPHHSDRLFGLPCARNGKLTGRNIHYTNQRAAKLVRPCRPNLGDRSTQFTFRKLCPEIASIGEGHLKTLAIFVVLVVLITALCAQVQSPLPWALDPKPRSYRGIYSGPIRRKSLPFVASPSVCVLLARCQSNIRTGRAMAYAHMNRLRRYLGCPVPPCSDTTKEFF
jgi:hypothetical protein